MGDAAIIGGERVDLARFREGWLLVNFGKGHYFRREGEFRALCGYTLPPLIRDTAGFFASEPGDFPLCKRCRALSGDR